MAVGVEHPVEAGEVDPRFRYQGGQAGDEVQGFEDDVGGAVAVRCLERISHIPLTGQGQPASGDGSREKGPN